MNHSIQHTYGGDTDNPQLIWVQLSCLVVNLGAVGCAAGLAEFRAGPMFSTDNPNHKTLLPQDIEKNAQLIGYASFQVPPGGTATVVCPKLMHAEWHDVQTNDMDLGAGVLVQINDLFTDRLTNPFDAVNDRHVARLDDGQL
jgi:hypothetical protein